MWWMAAVMAAQSFQKGKEAKAQAKVDKFVMKQNVKVANQAKQIDNTMAKAKGDLARFQQSQNNRAKLKAGGDSVEAQRTNMLRLSDSAVRGSFETRIQASEIAGALAAQAGFAGIGGGSLEMLNTTNNMRQQRAQELADRTVDNQLYDGQRNIDQTVEATVLGLDDVQFFDNINYQTAKESYIAEPSWLQIGGQAAMTFAKSYSEMGGFDKMGSKLGGMFGGGNSAATGSTQAGYSSQALSGWGGPTTTLR